MERETERGSEERQEASQSIGPDDATPAEGGAAGGYGPSGEPERAVEDRPQEQARDEADDEGFSAGAE